jgi:hypothetical protein
MVNLAPGTTAAVGGVMTNPSITQLAAGLLATFASVGVSATAAHPEAPPTALSGPTAETPVAAADPNVDRGFLLPTAMTQPRGSITYNNYELLLHGVTYGITDDVQGSLTILSPIVRDMPFVALGALKWRLFHNDRVHVAVQASGGYMNFRANSADNAFSVGTGAFASFCLREDCSSLLSVSATYQLFMAQIRTLNGDPVLARTHGLVYGASLVHRVASHVKLLAEVSSASSHTATSGFENLGGVLASYGVRFHSNNLAADVGFVRPILSDGGGDAFLMGVPFINVSYRWR